jgi:predicted metalloprotease with PDZ domain
MKSWCFRLSLVASALLLVGAARISAQSGPAIALTVDASMVQQKIVRTHEVMAVKEGPLTLYYPKWIPGEHEPDGPIANVTGLKFTANGKTIPWKRDLLDVFTFHVDVPAGANRLEIAFDYLEPSGAGGIYTAGASSTDKLVVVSWNQNLLYPADIPAEQMMFNPQLVLPEGWKYGTALSVDREAGHEIRFKPVSLDRLVDSPVSAGQYYRVIDLTPPGEPIHHEIDLAADSEDALNMSPELKQGLTNLVAETGKLFGARHYRDYHFLLTLSDHVAHFGLEHNESDDSRLGERALISPGGANSVAGLLAHEFVHSWNGKFRRPKDLFSPYYEAPMQTDLLWVYEGLTDYLGNVLAVRCGVWNDNDYHTYIADVAASLGPGRPGRAWDPLLDTAVSIPGMFGGGGWFNWRRGSDYYEEGDLIWLWVTTIIHDQSHGQKTFEDFLRAFYGGPNNGPEVKPYTFEELVQALNQVAPYDWASFLNERLMSTSPIAPVEGLEASGWKVDYMAQNGGGGRRGGRGGSNTTYSIGLSVQADGTVGDTIYGGPAFGAGVAPGMKVIGVNGRTYTAERLADAIQASQGTSQPIVLLVVNDDYFKMCTINYHDGEKYPHLVQEQGKPDYLDEILKPLAVH